MNTAPTDTNPVVTGLHLATNAASKLAALEVTLIAAYANGRRPVLIIDRQPPFVQGAMKCSRPGAFGGIERVYAAPYHGVQLEWQEHVPAQREVANG